MIIDVKKFAAEEQQYWDELDRALTRLESGSTFSIEDIKRLYYLYQRTSSDLAKLKTFAANSDLEVYLESLVSRAYAAIHATRRRRRFRPLHWLLATFPRAFRRRFRAFAASSLALFAGVLFGAVALSVDTRAKEVILGAYPHLRVDPSTRIEQERQHSGPNMLGNIGTAFYFTHNTRVSILVMGAGITYGLGTILLLFTNGVLLGAVILDYAAAGHIGFVTGWLLPHGSVEIPAVLIAGQAGLVIGHAVIGWGVRKNLAQRLREVSGDVVTLVFGTALLLLWAGGIESWFSQIHEPHLPAYVKITVGLINFTLLTVFLAFGGRRRTAADDDEWEETA